MKNPITRRRERAGMTRSAYCRALGASYCDLHAAETGRNQTIPRAVLAGLVRLGHNAEDLQREYLEWLTSEREALSADARADSALRNRETSPAGLHRLSPAACQ